MDEQLLNAIAGMIKIQKPKKENTDNSQQLSDEDINALATKIVETYNVLTNKMMQMNDVTADVVNKYLDIVTTQSEGIETATTNIASGTDVMVESLENLSFSVDKTTNRISTNTRNLEEVANNLDFDKSANSITKSVASATAESEKIYRVFEDDLDRRIKNSKVLNYSSKLGEMVSTFFAGVKDGLSTPFKFAADIVNLPKQIGAGIKDTMSGLKENFNTFKDAFSTGDWSSYFGAEEPKDDDTKIKVGIADKPLNTDEVLKYSTTGVAVAWLAKQIADGKDGGLSSAETSILGGGTGGISDMASNAIGTAIGNAPIFKGLASVLKSQALRTALPWAGRAAGIVGAGYMMYKDYKNRKDISDVTDKKASDITTVDRATSTISQTLFGNVGSGDPSDRGKNALNQAMKYAATGAVIGSVIPGIGTAIGAGVGGAVGWFGGLIGGDKMAGGIIRAKDKIVGAFDEMNSTIAESNAVRLKSINDTVTTMDEFNNKMKSSFPAWDNFIDWLFQRGENKGKGLIPTFPGSKYKLKDNKKTPEIGYSPDANVNTNAGGNIPKNISVNSSTLEKAYALIMRNEGSFGSLNPTDGKDRKYSIGSLQWHAGRGVNYLKQIRDVDPEVFDRQLGEDFYERLKKGGSATPKDKKNWENFAIWSKKNDPRFFEKDKRLGMNDVAGYLIQAQRAGITDENKQLLYADYLNQHGPKYIKDVFRNADTMSFEELAARVKSRAHIPSRTDKSVQFINTIAKTQPEVTKPTQPAPDLAAAKNQAEQVKTEANNKVITDAIMAGMTPALTAINKQAETYKDNKNNSDLQPMQSSAVAEVPNSSGIVESAIPTNILNFFFGINVGGVSDIFAG